MRILFLAPMFHPNQLSWIQTLIDNKHEVEFWFLRKRLEDGIKKLIPINPKKIEHPFSSKIFSYYQALKEFDPEVVVGRNPHLNFFIFLFLFISKLQGRKTVIYTQTDLYQKMPFWRKLTVIILLNTIGNYWITPLEGCAASYPKFHSRAFYIPFTIEAVDEEKVNGHNQIKIISVGKLNQKRKNVLLLLKALKKLEGVVDFHLTLVGHLNYRQQHYQEIIKYIKENKLKSRVTIKKNIPYPKMILEYRKNNLFILPSSSEPAAYSLLEAMAAGLPVICSDSNGTKCYIEEGKNGYVFKSDDLEDLAEKIRIITSDQEKMKKMGERSNQMVKDKHKVSLFYKAFMKVIGDY